MATELKTTETNTVLTRFYGGKERGVCIQVNSVKYNEHVQLTRTQAAQLAEDLLKFANGTEESK
jgi:hypothetical protein